MTTILIADTSILIDIDKICLLSELFHLPYSIKVTDFVQNECLSLDVKLMEDSGLIVGNLSGELVEKIHAIRQKHTCVSIADISALVLAQHEKAILLTGDKSLRKLSKEREIETHGILWLFDQMVENKILSHESACQLLRQLMTINSRLPNELCLSYIKKWSC